MKGERASGEDGEAKETCGQEYVGDAGSYGGIFEVTNFKLDILTRVRVGPRYQRAALERVRRFWLGL